MLESTSPFDQYSFISDISFSVLPCLKHMATCTQMYMYVVFKLFEKNNLYKNLPCFLHSLDFLFSKLKVLHFLLGWCCLLVAYFNRMVKPVDQNQPIQIKTILLNTENSYLDFIKGFFFTIIMELNALEQQCLLNTIILHKNRPYRKFQFFSYLK